MEVELVVGNFAIHSDGSYILRVLVSALMTLARKKEEARKERKKEPQWPLSRYLQAQARVSFEVCKCRAGQVNFGSAQPKLLSNSAAQ